MNINDFGQHSLITWTEEDLRKERQDMSEEVITKVDCPDYGQTLEITHIGYTDCSCGELTAELTVEWVKTEEKNRE